MSLSLYTNPAAITTNVGTTLLAAWLAGTSISRTGPTAPFSDTFDTAANIVAAIGGMQGAAWECQYLNYSGQTATLVAPAGVTLTGKAPSVATNTMALFAIYVSPAGAVTINILYRALIS